MDAHHRHSRHQHHTPPIPCTQRDTSHTTEPPPPSLIWQAYPLISKRGLKFLKQAHLAIKLRALLKADDWKAVVATLRGIADAVLKSMEEVEAAWSEVNDKCAEFGAALECALAAGRS